MRQLVLDAQNVQKKYKDKYALSGVDFNLERGEIHALLGPNGAGKTTLIKIISTLLRKDEGSVNVLGFDLDKDERQIRHVIGYVGQDTERSMYARLSPTENLRYFGALRGISKDVVDDKIAHFSEYFDFNGSFEKQFMHLSGGQKQAVVIMRALIHEPPILMLDEPTKGLDVIIAKKIRKFLKTLVEEEGKSLLLTSHILTEVDELSDRVSLINKGIIPITDSPLALKKAVGATEFVDLELSHLPELTQNRIKNLEVVKSSQMKEENWISFGVDDLFDGTQAIIEVLKGDHVKTGFKQHSVTLEDAFIHHIGAMNAFDH